jgi:hypothetical protein
MVGSRAEAQVEAPPASPPQSLADASGAAASRAQFLFQRAVLSYERKAFEKALEDFLASIDLYPTTPATKNAALCLRELGRFDEALQLLEEMPRRFPGLSDDELRENAIKIEELSVRVGWVELRGVRTSSRIFVDERDRGGAPASSRLPLSSGRHRIRVVADGMMPAEIPVSVASGQTVVADVDQRPVESSGVSLPWVLGVEVAGTVTPSLGGEVAGCGGCERPVASGGRVMARAGHAVAQNFELSIEGGYAVMTESVDHRPTTVFAVGGLEDPGSASDALSMRGGLVGLSLAYRVSSLGESFVRASVGTFVGSVRDGRTGSFHTVPTDQAPSFRYDANKTQTQPAHYGYLSFAFALGFRPAPSFRLSAGVDVMALVALRRPEWDPDCDACKISGGGDGDSTFARESLSGKFVILVSPFLNAGWTF